jgi:hypothetical protein
MAGRANNAQRLDALEVANKALMDKMDALLNAMAPGAYHAPAIQAPSADNTAEMLRILLPHLAKQNPPPQPRQPQLDLTKVLVAILPALLQAMLHRPDPIETLAALKELNEPDPTENMLAQAMPLLMMKLAGTGAAAGSAGVTAPTAALGGADDASPDLAELLARIDPQTIAAILGGQAASHAGHVPQ